MQLIKLQVNLEKSHSVENIQKETYRFTKGAEWSRNLREISYVKDKFER